MPKEIRQITARGLTYRDEHGEERFIDFAECFERCVHEQARRGVPVEQARRAQLVGTRNVLTPPWADGPFIELYTTPPTRFQFATEGEYEQARDAIEAAGWRTLDLS